MKNLKLALPLLLATIVLASNALSQTDNPRAMNELPSHVAAARCQYTPGDDACSGESDSAQPQGRNDGTLAQLPRQMSRPPFRTGHPAMGRPAYPGMWQPRYEGSPAHALIGTLIGFGLGAAVGAKGNIGVRGTLAFGAIGAGIGAGIGFSLPSCHFRNPYWHRWPYQDEEASSRKTAKPSAAQPNSPQPTASADPVPSGPRTSAEVAVSPTPGR